MARPAKKKQEQPIEVPQEQTTTPTVKRTRFRSAVKNTSFDIFSEEAAAQRTKDLMAKVGMGEGFSSSTQAVRDYLPVPWLALQYLIGRPGIPLNTITEIIGAEGVGKSSLTYALMGEFIGNNIPCYYINSEPKALEPDWQLRLLGSDTQRAIKIRDIINVQPLYSLVEMDEHIRAWVNIKRNEEGVPMDVPLVVIVDSITKLMNPEEFAASGLVKLKPGEKRKAEGVNGISMKPGVTAQWIHKWSRLMPNYMEANNLTIICVGGQNQNMNAGATPSFITPSEKHNDTRIGGEALRQNAALRFTVTYKAAVKNSANVAVGKEILLYCKKNSYGPSYREVRYHIYDDRIENYKLDVPGTFTQQAINMDVGLASVMADNRILGTTVNKKRYTSTKLEAYELPADEFISHIVGRPDAFKAVVTALSIKGYEFDEEDPGPGGE